LIPTRSVFAFLAEHREALFPAGMFADMYPSRNGRPSVDAAADPGCGDDAAGPARHRRRRARARRRPARGRVQEPVRRLPAQGTLHHRESRAWLVYGGNRRLHYRGAIANNTWIHTRAAALNLRTLINLGLTRTDGRWNLPTTA
jgi:hypothetical protein